MGHGLETVENLKIAYIGGGSRGWAWGLMSDLAVEESMSGRVMLYDIDSKAAERNEIIGNKLKERDDIHSQWTYKSADSLQEAVSDADFVIISILPGTFQDMYWDVHAPEAYGVYQSVGDTVGPGGLMRALRTLPMYEVIGEAIKKYAPNSWVINYTNPMTLCTKMLYNVFPEIKALGNCHEVFGTQKLLVECLKVMEGIEDIKREEIHINVLGINHFTWITEATYKDQDIFPIYEAFVKNYYDSGYTTEKDGNWLNDYFACSHRVKFDLFNRYGYIAAAGDRHLAEFCPQDWYLKNPEVVKSWMFGLTPVDWRIEHRKKLDEQSLAMVSGAKEFEIKETGEEGVKQMKALLGIQDLVTNVNMPNQGQISNLPNGAVVETNALLRTNAVHPITAGPIPQEILGLVSRQVNNQALILEAVNERSLKKAFQAFANDPLMAVSTKEARECFDKMVDHTKAYLSEYAW